MMPPIRSAWLMPSFNSFPSYAINFPFGKKRTEKIHIFFLFLVESAWLMSCFNSCFPSPSLNAGLGHGTATTSPTSLNYEKRQSRVYTEATTSSGCCSWCSSGSCKGQQ